MEKEEEDRDLITHDHNEDDFYTCSDGSCSCEEPINQIATVPAEDSNGIHLPFGIKEGTKISCL